MSQMDDLDIEDDAALFSSTKEWIQQIGKNFNNNSKITGLNWHSQDQNAEA